MAGRNQKRKAAAEILFWIHTAVVLLIAASGLFVSWPWVITILIVLRLQQIVFHGCILTVFEIKEGGIPKGTAYFQVAARRFFGYRLSRMGVHVVFTVHVVITLLVSVLATKYHIRL